MTIDFDAVFERSPNAYMLLDRGLRFVAVNTAYLRVTESRREDLLGKHVIDAFPHDAEDPDNANARQLRESFERVIATRETDALAHIVYRVPRHEGGRVVVEPRFWSATHTPILDARGEVAFILQHTVDVTEVQQLRQLAGPALGDGESHAGAGDLEAGVLGRARRVQEQNRTLDAERRHLLRLFDQAPSFICFLRGPEHVFTLANPAYYQLLGHRDLLDKSVREAVPEAAGQGFIELLDRVFTSAEPFVGRGMRLLLQRSPGDAVREAFLDFVYQPIVEASGEVTGILVQGYEITEQRRLESERDALLVREQAARADAESANRLKDEFLATLSHELRTPLNAMLGWVLLLRGGGAADAQRAHALEAIERNARAQSQVIDDLFDVSIMLSGKLHLEPAPVAVAAVVDACLEALRPAAEAKGILLQATLAPDATVVGDRGRLHQVVMNLLSNAVKFTPGQGRVDVRLTRRDDQVELTVSDTGAGIVPDFLPHVFDRFRQADGGTTRAHGGLGLGLAIVKHLVEAHVGTVAASSDGEGSGATFTVRLPAAPVERVERSTTIPPIPASGASPATGEVARPLAGLRLLVVDDESDARELVRAILTKEGAEVETASSAVEAFEAFRRRRPDVLVSDIGMPGEDGYSLIRRIRALSPEEGGAVPAIALTAYTRAIDRARALVAGFKAHVPKPIAPAELRAVLTALLFPGESR